MNAFSEILGVPPTSGVNIELKTQAPEITGGTLLFSDVLESQEVNIEIDLTPDTLPVQTTLTQAPRQTPLQSELAPVPPPQAHPQTEFTPLPIAQADLQSEPAPVPPPQAHPQTEFTPLPITQADLQSELPQSQQNNAAPGLETPEVTASTPPSTQTPILNAPIVESTQPNLAATAPLGSLPVSAEARQTAQQTSVPPTTSPDKTIDQVNAAPIEAIKGPRTTSAPEIITPASTPAPINLDTASTQTGEASSAPILGASQSTNGLSLPPASVNLPTQANPILARPAEIPTIVSETITTAEPGNDRVVVQLDPPELGRVTIDFKFDGQVLQGVTITGESPEALRQLRNMHFELIQALEQNGLSNNDLDFRQEEPPQRQLNTSQGAQGDAAEDPEPNQSPNWEVSSSQLPAHQQDTNSGLDIKV